MCYSHMCCKCAVSAICGLLGCLNHRTTEHEKKISLYALQYSQSLEHALEEKVCCSS